MSSLSECSWGPDKVIFLYVSLKKLIHWLEFPFCKLTAKPVLLSCQWVLLVSSHNLITCTYQLHALKCCSLNLLMINTSKQPLPLSRSYKYSLESWITECQRCTQIMHVKTIKNSGIEEAHWELWLIHGILFHQ